MANPSAALISDTTESAPTSSCERSETKRSEKYAVRALVEAARNGEEDAWEALFRRSYPKLLAYAARRLPSQELAKDAVGETMTRAVANIDRLRFEGGGFDAWMYGIARHVVFDARRRMWREGPGVVPDVVDVSPGPGDRALAREDSDELRAAFAQLNAADQELLELRVVAELSAEEVASVLGRRPGAIRMAQSRALARLRNHLLATTR
jgi:RNA polymerase sigma-70 factor (ECF subfamily)